MASWVYGMTQQHHLPVMRHFPSQQARRSIGGMLKCLRQCNYPASLSAYAQLVARDWWHDWTGGSRIYEPGECCRWLFLGTRNQSRAVR